MAAGGRGRSRRRTRFGAADDFFSELGSIAGIGVGFRARDRGNRLVVGVRGNARGHGRQERITDTICEFDQQLDGQRSIHLTDAYDLHLP